MKEWMKFHSISNRAYESARETVFLPGFRIFFLSHARDCMTFTLHDLTDFLRRKGTAQRINIIDHSCFHNHWPTSKMKLHETSLRARGPLVFRGPYAACILCV